MANPEDERGSLCQVEEPTVRMVFLVNTSPFAGREGKFVTSRNIKERLDRELERNLVRPITSHLALDVWSVLCRIPSSRYDSHDISQHFHLRILR